MKCLVLVSAFMLFLAADIACGQLVWSHIFDSSSSTGTYPPARRSHAMVYDSTTNQIVIFGGKSTSTGDVLGDTWIYNVTSGELYFYSARF